MSLFAYNFLTCEGFQVFGRGTGTAECNFAWTMCVVAMMLTVFIALILNRQCKDGILAGTKYNVIGAIALGFIAFFIVTSIFGDGRWAFMGGLLGVAAGGFGIGLIHDMAEGESESG